MQQSGDLIFFIITIIIIMLIIMINRNLVPYYALKCLFNVQKKDHIARCPERREERPICFFFTYIFLRFTYGYYTPWSLFTVHLVKLKRISLCVCQDILIVIILTSEKPHCLR